VTLALLPQPDAREGRDRLKILAALICAPSFDPLFRADFIKIPAGHPVCRWNCLAGCDLTLRLCHYHQFRWYNYRPAR
jgi:hypothetical protein